MAEPDVINYAPTAKPRSTVPVIARDSASEQRDRDFMLFGTAFPDAGETPTQYNDRHPALFNQHLPSARRIAAHNAEVTARTIPTVGQLRASGQQDVNALVNPSPLPQPPQLGITPAPTLAQTWSQRALDGLGSFGSGVTTSPSAPIRPVASTVPAKPLSTVGGLEQGLNDLEAKSTVASPFYKNRLKDYVVVQAANQEDK
jgi:hypothetical protein